MPAQDRIRRHDRSDLGQHSVAKGFSFRRQATTLGVGEAEASASELLLQDSILFTEVLDRGNLVTANPADGLRPTGPDLANLWAGESWGVAGSRPCKPPEQEST